MSEQRCDQCGMIIADPALNGLCPGCLLGLGLATEVVETMAPDPIEQARVEALFPELEILALLGRGGMGTVYKARQVEIDRVVALKLLDPSLASEEAFQERFAREGRALARLDHPNIVRLLEYGTREDGNGDVYYLFLEFVDGSDLRGLLTSGQLEPRRVLSIVPQICDALGYAHDLGVVHRDIKPENILVDQVGRVRITDFGLAKLIADTDTRLTADGTLMGTPYYMAPEQVDAPAAVDHRADIYSLGVVCYELLTGDLPLGRFDPPSSKADVAPHVDAVVMRSLEKEPTRRYQHTSELKEAIAGGVTADTTAENAERWEKGSHLLMQVVVFKWLLFLLVLGYSHMSGDSSVVLRIFRDLGEDAPWIVETMGTMHPFVQQLLVFAVISFLIAKERMISNRAVTFMINLVALFLPWAIWVALKTVELLYFFQMMEGLGS